ncbi:helix-turn-helix domain-containing protein [Escherichia coli]|uniref:helix-turn-helix domain-containing protein n=1 Tax=Escherichia coli TaxID=562 RepID=UPI0010F412B8|nr:helix-turn-helix transcriptional regulator [Escherichia coli]GCR47879.1 c-di-GMP-specific phosphodiesterase [Escherichia coli]
MEMKKNICYIKSEIKEHDITVHLWVFVSLTKIECDVLELIMKGYSSTKISHLRNRSNKTVSSQKRQIYKKLGIRNDLTFWIDILLSPAIRAVFYRKGEVINIENEIFGMSGDALKLWNNSLNTSPDKK